jgi:hypothetical protein
MTGKENIERYIEAHKIFDLEGFSICETVPASSFVPRAE